MNNNRAWALAAYETIKSSPQWEAWTARPARAPLLDGTAGALRAESGIEVMLDAQLRVKTDDPMFEAASFALLSAASNSVCSYSCRARAMEFVFDALGRDAYEALVTLDQLFPLDPR